MEYSSYINSKEWKAKRQEVFKFYGKKCVLCWSTKGLNVHHLTYKKLGKEPMMHLLPLCSRDHLLIHRFQEEYDLSIWHATIEFLAIKGLDIKTLWNKKKKKQDKKTKKKRKKKKPRIPKAIWHGVKRKY